jgi:AsmA protein
MPETAPAQRRSRRFLKYALLTLGALALAVGAAIAYLVVTFDPRDYHDRIVEIVRDKTGRTLAIKGEIALSFWPDVAARLGAVTLSERESSEPFVALEGARIRLQLVPLLRRELIATELAITGASIRITRHEDGRLNIDDLLKGEGATPTFDIGKLVVERSTLTYIDLGAGTRYDFGGISLETGRLANTVTTPVKLAFTLSDAADRVGIAARVTTTLDFDLPQQRYGARQAQLEVKGRIPGMADLAARASGDAVAQMKQNEITVSALDAAMSGTHGADALTVAVEARQLVIAPAEARGEGVRVAVTARGPAGTTEAKLTLPALHWAEGTVASEAAALDLTLVRGEHSVRAALSTPVKVAIAPRELALSRIDATFTVLGPRLPRNGVAGRIKGDAQVDVEKEGVRMTVAGKVADSNVKAQITAAGFAAPVYSFVVDIDQLDLDRYIGENASAAKRTQPSVNPAARLLEPLADLPATGTLTVGVLKSSNVKAGNVRLVLK